MDVEVRVSDQWVFAAKASAFHATRPATADCIAANIGPIAFAALKITGVPTAGNTNPSTRVTRVDVPNLGSDTDVLITVLAPRPWFDYSGRLRYMTTIVLETTRGIRALLGDDPPRFSVRVRLVEECEVACGTDGRVVSSWGTSD